VWTLRTARRFIVILIVAAIVHVGTRLVVIVRAIGLDTVAALDLVVAVVAVLVGERGVAALSGLATTVRLHFVFFFGVVVLHIGVAATLRSWGVGPVVYGSSCCEAIGCWRAVVVEVWVATKSSIGTD
jgi:hypothetical protein